jgi:predicted sulfurtransferase
MNNHSVFLFLILKTAYGSSCDKSCRAFLKSTRYSGKLSLLLSSSQYVYCRSGRRSANAQKMMKNIGFQEVCNVKGGVLRLGANGVELVKP